MPSSPHRTPLPAQTAEYAPRKPQDTILHRLVREHYATFVAHTESTYAAPLPRYVKDAFERYLACGDFVSAARAPFFRDPPPAPKLAA